MSNSTTSPRLRTKILSEFIMVLILWAIVITVAYLKHSRIAFWMSWSAFTSILAVASSINTSLLFLRIALAIHTSCFSPIDKLSPASDILVSRPSLSEKTVSKQHFLSVSRRYGSACSFLGSRFSLRVP